jgi:hypothetical protein
MNKTMKFAQLRTLALETHKAYEDNDLGFISANPHGGGPVIQLTEESFSETFGFDYNAIQRDCSDYPIERSKEVDGVRFFCLSKK